MATRRRRLRHQTNVAAVVTLSVEAAAVLTAVLIWRSVLAAFLAVLVVAVVVMIGALPLMIRQARREADGRREPDPPPLEPSPRAMKFLKLVTKVVLLLLGLTVLTGIIQAVVLLAGH